MTGRAQLVQHIRFGLQTLAERNAHHEFEQLCLGLARRRVASNLLPATGPVGAGGDQGRDGESHWTNLPAELPGTSLFVAGASEDTVVLACTIQASGLKSKIGSDLDAICGQGAAVQRVVYFVTSPVPVGTRHTLQAEALKEHGVALDVWDAPAIAEHLADADLFYLAVDHLRLASELSPEQPTVGPAVPQWYLDDRERWRGKQQFGSTLGELIDLRRALRYATFHVEVRADLPEWLAWARQLLTDATSSETQARARYEIAVATVRGMNTLRPADDLVGAFFEQLPELTDPGILTDAQYLLEYCLGAMLRRLTAITRDTLEAWSDVLGRRVDELLADDPYPNAKANLLGLRARHSLQPKLPTAEHLAAALDLVPIPDVVAAVVEAVEAGDVLLPDVEGLELCDVAGGMAALLELVEHLGRAPLFPVEHTADMFDMLAPLLVEHPDYARVRAGLDDAIARSNGEAARGDRAYSRAVRFLEMGQLLRALDEVHEAKVSWWQGDTVGAGLEMMLLASRIYSELGLPIAAKQHALAAAVAAKSSTDPDHGEFTARGLILAATYDHQAGHWLSATHAFRVGILAQGALVEDPWDIERHRYFYDMAMDQALILRAVRTSASKYAEVVERVVADTGLLGLIGPWVDHVEGLPPMTAEEYATAADKDGLGRPFSDAGARRLYSWAALGITWEVTTENDRLAVLATERFVAALHVVLAELASVDALFLSTRVVIDVRPDRTGLADTDEYIEDVPDNDVSRWVLHLLPFGEGSVDDHLHEVTAALVSILMACSLLPGGDFMAIITAAFERGLWHKLAAGRPFDELADFLDDSVYEELKSLAGPAFGAGIPARPQPAHEVLAWRDQPAPGYDRDSSVEAVAARYERMGAMARYTVQRLGRDEGFRLTASALRREGWLDWHLLSGIANHLGNRRIHWNGMRPTTTTPPAEQSLMRSLMMAPEKPDDPQLPASEFDAATLRAALTGSVISTLASLGLTTHARTPNFKSIFEFLGARYGYWTDDSPHEEMFGELDAVR